MRTWEMGDPEPSDHPPIVDDDSITWLWMELEDDGEWFYVQQHVAINGNWGNGFRWERWEDLLENYGPVREATPDEITNLDVSY